jgi:predicted alpha/beta-fold hydrolase
LYLLGISAGAALSAKYIGMYNNTGIFTAYGSLSNPYNLTRVCYHLDNLFWGRIVSKFMASSSKKQIESLQGNPNFQKLIKDMNLDNDKADSELSNSETRWELDAKYIYRMAGIKYYVNKY